jgi:predicted PurR-regulated permease PerM
MVAAMERRGVARIAGASLIVATLIVGLAQDGDIMRGMTMGAAALAITTVEGWLITPPLLGKVERMNPIVIFLGLLVWTWIWGAWGTILAVPMLSVVKAV